jgi:hypothetical protein
MLFIKLLELHALMELMSFISDKMVLFKNGKTFSK